MSKCKSEMTYSRSAGVVTEESEEGAKAWVSRLKQMFENRGEQPEDPTAGCWMENMIYSVPTVMMENVNATKLFYPAVIGIGPLHFRCSEDVGASTGGLVRRIKEEAISLIMKPYPAEMQKELMDELIRLIGKDEARIRASYSNPVRIPHFLEGDVFAWMMVVDVCFLLVALSILSSKTWVERDELPALALLQDEVSSRAGELLQDLLKMENQIPLWVVRKVAEHLPGWEPEDDEISKRVDMETVLTELSPFHQRPSGVSGSSRSRWRSISRWRVCYSERKGTLLYVLLLFIIGDPRTDAEWVGRSDKSVPACKRALHALGSIIPLPIRSLLQLLWEMLSQTPTLTLTRGSLLLHRECPWPFHLAASMVTIAAMPGVLAITLLLLLMGLLCLPLLLVVCMWREKHTNDDDDDHKGTQALANSRVSIYTAEPGNISSVHWTQNSDGLDGELLLPFLRLDEVAMVALWNMLILENCCPQLSQTKSLSNYIRLMSCVLASFDDLEPLGTQRSTTAINNSYCVEENSATIPDRLSDDRVLPIFEALQEDAQGTDTRQVLAQSFG